jgi:IPT/TIG domain
MDCEGLLNNSNSAPVPAPDPRAMRTRVAIVIVVVALFGLVFAAPALADPVVTGVNPDEGPPAGGNLVTISGMGLTGGISTEVDFGSVPAIIQTTSPTTLTVNAPPGTPGTVHVTVLTSGVRSAATDADLYTYDPAVTSLDPSHGPAVGGNQVTIVGSGFGGTPTVMFGSKAASGVHVIGPTTITADAPPGAVGRTVDVTVTTSDGTSNRAGTGNDYTYDRNPNTFFTHHPPRRTHRRNVAFAFDSNADGARFKCFYAKGWAKCRSPHVFRHLKPGRYQFKVKAIFDGAPDPTPAKFVFRILP